MLSPFVSCVEAMAYDFGKTCGRDSIFECQFFGTVHPLVTMIAFSTHGFSLVVCRHPDGRFLAVKEKKGRGWWLPAGHVDEGENFLEGGIRETLEEAGISVDLKGILAVEHSLVSERDARMRVIFYAEPTDPTQLPKSIPDKESDYASWLSLSELDKLKDLPPPDGLRGFELLNWCRYVHNGGLIAPLTYHTNLGRIVKYDGFFRIEDSGPRRPFPSPAIITHPSPPLPPSPLIPLPPPTPFPPLPEPTSLFLDMEVGQLEVLRQKKWTSLHLAVHQEDISQVRRLLLEGYRDSDCLTHRGRTPLHFASSRNHFEIVKLLLLSGTANLDIVDSDGATAFDMLDQGSEGGQKIMKFFTFYRENMIY